jgi:hypothetical protein
MKTIIAMQKYDYEIPRTSPIELKLEEFILKYDINIISMIPSNII